MSKPNFTPGPWPIELVPTQVGQCFKIGKFPSDSRRNETYACIYLDYTSPTSASGIELSANAHLIAAAPELYEELDDLQDIHQWDAKAWETRKNVIRRLLAKARGEA